MLGWLEWYYFRNISFAHLFQKLFTECDGYFYNITEKILIKARINKSKQN